MNADMENLDKMNASGLCDYLNEDPADEERATLCITSALKHLSDFHWMSKGEVWDRDDVRDACYNLGEIIYEENDLGGLQNVYYNVRSEMKGVAARYLEHFWDGVGDGAWRG